MINCVLKGFQYASRAILIHSGFLGDFSAIYTAPPGRDADSEDEEGSNSSGTPDESSGEEDKYEEDESDKDEDDEEDMEMKRTKKIGTLWMLLRLWNLSTALKTLPGTFSKIFSLLDY